MLPLVHKILFFVFALVAGGVGLYGFWRLYRRVRRGRPDVEARANRPLARLWYALRATLTQERTFRKRRFLSVFHAFIFYGFTYYLLVNVVDGLEGYIEFNITSKTFLGALYNFTADLLSVLVLVGVIAFVVRRYLAPQRRDFRFNEKTLLHENVKRGAITRDSAFVSAFILFHVGSRLLGNGAKMAEYGGDPWQPFSTALAPLFAPEAAYDWRIFFYWTALGSILAFLAYFPFSKHLHIFAAPVNYFFRRERVSGELPPMKVDLEAENPDMGAERLEDLAWPRLLDAYACIQCNRCQDVCPASGTGKALSPAALEINKRMELNVIASHASPFTLKQAGYETGGASPRPLLEFAISPEAVWACTTCGACMQVCPVQDEQMLDIVDIRRRMVMVEGEFPPQLQTAFRGMERAKNPWGISRDKRMDWAEGLKVPTIDENPTPDVLYWVGCAASYDPGAQKTARAFVQLLDRAGVNYAVLGKREACTGDSARRAGNEFLYQQLAEENVATLNEVRPKLVVATCPHCMNAIGNEYRQIGGHYEVIHHTTYLERLTAMGRLETAPLDAAVTYHDPCYLGRHNGVYDAPRAVIQAMGAQVLELERSRESSFCCGAGGAQFWKEEEEGHERISDNRFKEIQARLDSAKEGKVVAVGCPFGKSMLNSTPSKAAAEDIVVKDVAELLLESHRRATGEDTAPLASPVPPAPQAETPPLIEATPPSNLVPEPPLDTPPPGDNYTQPGTTTAEVEAAHAAHEEVGDRPAPAERRKWGGQKTADDVAPTPPAGAAESPAAPAADRPKWSPKKTDDVSPVPPAGAAEPTAGPARKKWSPKAVDDVSATPPAPTDAAPAAPTAERPKWSPKKTTDDVSPVPPADPAPTPAPDAEAPRKKWAPKGAPAPVEAAPVEPTPPAPIDPTPAERPKWTPRAKAADPVPEPALSPEERSSVAHTPAEKAETASMAPAPIEPAPARPKWTPKAAAPTPEATPPAPAEPAPLDAAPAEPAPSPDAPTARPKWTPKKKD